MERLDSPQLSACLVLHNEEAVIERCLRSLDGLDAEIIVVHDGPCSDRTLEIARRYTPHVFERPFAGHMERHRVFTFQQARGEWLLTLDADEFLSSEMASILPELMARGDVSAYRFVWPLWDGRRALTSDGPPRMVLLRRSATEFVGAIHNSPVVHGPVEDRREVLHHQPAYNNYNWESAMTKQRRWARVQAAQLTGPFSDLPAFNYRGPKRWSSRLRIMNRFSPLIAIPYGAYTFIRGLRNRPWYPSHPALPVKVRVSFYMGVYRAMVYLYVARRLYLEPTLRAWRRLGGASRGGRR
jgi:glycosyltransferase involved in cell wall biosynthesis